MKKYLITTLIMSIIVIQVNAQVFITRNGTIRFFSEAPLENIEAINRQVFAALDTESGEMAFRVVMRAFTFEKALMQQHFNDNFVESHQYPNATFEGTVKDISSIDFSVDGQHNVEVMGNLTIKDVTKSITEPGVLEIKDGNIMAESIFMVKPEEYNISIPGRYVRNIASEIEVSVRLELRPR